jgi:hypothetical protein
MVLHFVNAEMHSFGRGNTQANAPGTCQPLVPGAAIRGYPRPLKYVTVFMKLGT